VNTDLVDRPDPGSDLGVARVPELTPIEVISDADVQELLRTSRATVAALTLKLRSTLAAAERTEADAVAVSPNAVDEDRRREISEIAARRHRDLDEELVEARREADALVAAARARAIATMVSAPETVVARPEPVVSDADLVRPLVAPIPVAAPPAAPVPNSSYAVPQSFMTVMVPSGDPSAPGAMVPMMVPTFGTPTAAGYVTAAEAGRQGASPAVGPSRGFFRRIFHIDVILPVVATVVVLVVLLAWLG
jgi:hypothetical protein